MNLFRKAGLRVRLAWSIALPLLVLMSAFSFWQYTREIKFIQSESENDAMTMSDVVLTGLKHAMLIHDNSMIDSMIENNIGVSNIQRVLLINQKNVVKADSSSDGNQNGATLDTKLPGCAECHQFPADTMPQIADLNIGGADILRVATPIENSLECNQCHNSRQQYLGVLLVDVSIQKAQSQAKQNALLNLGLSILTTIFIFAAIYFVLDILAIRRIRAFMKPLNAYANGDYEARLPISNAGDELDHLAHTFNSMIVEIETHIEEERKRGELLSKVIVEERERIARELHDSLPQLLAYLNTKIGAIYLFVEGGKKKEALTNLRELEHAARNLLTDVRDAIIGLRASRFLASGLTVAVQNYLDQFKDISNIPVAYSSELDTSKVHLPPETEVQALRIVQEALSNIRKHSKATKAAVQILLKEQQLILIIEDNGIGFTPPTQSSGKSQFGLQTMRERAESLHGEFMIQSRAGEGTKITVTLPIP